MPTAVLMGMGLTPRLAQADELPKNPFTGHSCADETPDDSSSSATPSPSSSSGSSGSKDSKGSGDSSGDKASATPSPSATPSSKDSQSSDDDSKTAGKASSSPSPSPSASKSTNPLDPLGIGDALGKLLGGGSDSTSSTPSASATPSPSASSQTGTTSDSGSGSDSSSSSSSSSATKTVEDTAKNVEKTVKDTTKKATGTAEKATKDVTSGASASPSSDPSAYPCPTYDAKALADADYEKTSSLLPDDPWILKTDLLTLHGLDYAGIVKVKTYDGTVKDVLKFTASGVDIRNLHQITEGPDGTKYHVQARAGSTSTIRNGTVTMYTEELKGNLFGIIPVTFSPKSPPPLNISEVFFSNVTVTQAGQFGGTLTIPGMHIYNADS
jgi:hypothetical protein